MVQEDAHPAPCPAQSCSRDEGLLWRQTPSSRKKLGFFLPSNPSVLNFFGGFTPNSSDSMANALQSSAPLPQRLPSPGQRENTNPRIHQQMTRVQPASPAATQKQHEPLLGAVPAHPAVQQQQTTGLMAGDTRLHIAPVPACIHPSLCAVIHTRCRVQSSGPFFPTPGPSGANHTATFSPHILSPPADQEADVLPARALLGGVSICFYHF